MYLKCSVRRKDGKVHRSWSIVESRRLCDGRTIQRHVLYLGEINDQQQVGWQKSIEAWSEDSSQHQQIALFPEDTHPLQTPADAQVVQIRLSELELHRPRQWGGCWLALELWHLLGLDAFWKQRLPPSREGTRWDQVLTALVVYRLLSPGSEWRLHRSWFDRSALADLLGSDARLAADDTLYRCHDRLVEHKEALFSHLQQRWGELFAARFEILLYDLTSTYFECDAPDPAADPLRRHGYSRDKRPDCVQVVLALIINPEGFPLAYEVLAGNTSDKSTLGDFLAKIERRYGKADRIWLMDRGIPTEETLEQMRQSTPPISYVVGTPRSRLNHFAEDLMSKQWQVVREGLEVKLLQEDGELYVLTKSHRRVGKERAMRRRKLKKLWARLRHLQRQNLRYEALLLKIGAAQAEAGVCAKLVDITFPDRAAGCERPVSWAFHLRKDRLRELLRREGRYLLRTNLTEENPARLWELYMLLVQIEEAFRNLKGDLALRPVFHQKEHRIEAHIFLSFLAYCLHVTLRARLRPLAPGLTPRAVLEKFSGIQMLDVLVPTTDGRNLELSRYTQPDRDCQLLLEKLRLELPAQPPPKIRGNDPRA